MQLGAQEAQLRKLIERPSSGRAPALYAVPCRLVFSGASAVNMSRTPAQIRSRRVQVLLAHDELVYEREVAQAVRAQQAEELPADLGLVGVHRQRL